MPTVKDDVDTQNVDKFSHDDAAPDTSAPPEVGAGGHAKVAAAAASIPAGQSTWPAT